MNNMPIINQCRTTITRKLPNVTMGTSIIVVIASLTLMIAANEPTSDPQPPVAGTALLDETWKLVDADFFDPHFNGVDWPAMLEKHRPAAMAARNPAESADVINAMLAELGTSHTHLYTNDQRAYYELLDLFSGLADRDQVRAAFPDGVVRYEGIGIVTKVVDGRAFIHDVLEGSPAAAFGLLIGDEIITVDGNSFHEIESFRGRADGEVTIEIQRTVEPSSRQLMAVKPRWIVPNELFNTSIEKSARIIEHEGRKVAYVRVRSYASPTYHETLEQLLLFGTLREAETLVLDLRGGWGGAMPGYFNLFNTAVPALRQLRRDGSVNLYESAWRKPVVVLIDGGTRSGKEILAHAFKATGRAVLVGERTAGAVVGGSPRLLRDGSLLMIAVQDVEVDGVRLEGGGVEPNVEVKWDVRYAAGRDPQMERAIEIAATLTRNAIDSKEGH